MKPNYDKNPGIRIDNITIWDGWDPIVEQWKKDIRAIQSPVKILVLECYTGVYEQEIEQALGQLQPTKIIHSSFVFKSEDEILKMTHPDVTDDRIFGRITGLNINDFIDQEKLNNQVQKLIQHAKQHPESLIAVYGPASSLILKTLTLTLPVSLTPYALISYLEPSRWEIQTRMKAKRVHGLGVHDHDLEFPRQYKRGYFVDWRVLDKLKQELYSEIDYFVDTNIEAHPKMLRGNDFHAALQEIAHQPFRVVPYFDPGPWGGQWMKEVCDLDKSKENFAWCFDCVPEENSLKLVVGDIEFETPSINLVFTQSKALLGEAVEARFGKEFPIRFDFLDTMDGGNLSFQVHPTTEYIRQNFGMQYTQDESYYILDAEADGSVYLGLTDEADPKEMIEALKKANSEGSDFPAEKYANIWPAKKHDHFLIPAGTVHCSGKNAMVLEISSTPYIFTFKMWDWNRLGMDGKPRPINIDHAEKVIQWDRRTEFTKNELVNTISQIDKGDGWREEKTGLHELEFIETRRHWFTKPVTHQTEGSVNVLNLIEGREAIITSPTEAFEPFIVHYAETFIIPEAVKEYTIAPHGESLGQEIGTIKARVRV